MIHSALRWLGLDPVMVVTVVSMIVAQAAKGISASLRAHKLLLHRFVAAGGMPSSHSALVAALVTGVGFSNGWTSGETSVAIVVALLAMWDAMTVRHAVGQQARALNALMSRLDSDPLRLEAERVSTETLRELEGHTPLQVMAGAAVGIMVAFAVFVI